MQQDERAKCSRRLSRLLRHEPSSAGLTLDPHGWADVDELLVALDLMSWSMSYADLEEVVATSDKQRFALDPVKRRIRANQGHSVEVDLGLTAELPPTQMFHGTVDRFLPSIREQGLIAGQRHHVHLSADRVTAERVGARRGEPVVLSVDAFGMVMSGMQFFRSANGVWLTDWVPAHRITFPSTDEDDICSVGLAW